MTERLSAHFTLAELTVSQAAARKGLDNTPPIEVMPALRLLALGLEGIRILLGAPIIVNSGYRSPAVNAAVGGSPTSQHMRGEAADIICPGFGSPRAVATRIVEAGIDYDQCIVEFGAWVHVSFVRHGRRQALIIDHAGTRPMFA